MNVGQGYLLVVEDDPDISILLEKTLTIRGYRVITACNGAEGLEMICKDHPALVIADIMMPKMDGFGLVHRLRINPETRTIPVIFVTVTYIAREDREFALNIGATRFIQKPIDFEKFLKTVEELLKQDESVAPEPLDEFEFCNGYRQRLEAKLGQKISQIAQEKQLLETTSSRVEKQFLQASLDLALNEREEIKSLLDQIHEQLTKHIQSN